MRKFLVILLVLTLVLMSANAFAVKRFRIATAGTSGSLYPMGVLMAETINKHLPDFKASAESSAGSLANIRNLSLGKVEWGIAQNDIAWFAYNGLGPFKGKKITELRSLFGTLSGWLQIFVPKNSDIKSIKDFKGKRVSVGAAGSGGEIDARLILGYYGITYKDIKPFFLREKDAVAALKDGTIDAMIATHPLKSAAFRDLTTSFDVRMISLDDDGLYKKYPFFNKNVVPVGTYRGVDYPVTTASIVVFMYTTTKAGFSEDEIYKLLKAIFENRDEWKDASASVKKYVKLENALKGAAIPLHVGAIKFFKEKGFEIPDFLYPPEYKK